MRSSPGFDRGIKSHSRKNTFELPCFISALPIQRTEVGGRGERVVSVLDALGGQAPFCRVSVPYLGISKICSAQTR